MSEDGGRKADRERSELTSEKKPEKRCHECGCVLTEKTAYDDTICSQCYIGELEDEVMEADGGEV